MPMPGIFSSINSLIQGNLVGNNLKELSKDLPDGTVITQEGWVDSIIVPDTSVYIKGNMIYWLKTPTEHTLLLI